MKNPKTTVLGILAVVSAVVVIVKDLIAGTPIDFTVVGPQIMLGISSIFAADAKAASPTPTPTSPVGGV